MIAPTAIDLRTGKVGTSGTDKSVPYRVQAKFCTNIAQLPGVRNDTVSTAASNRDTAKKQKAGIGSPLKKRNDTVSTNVSIPGHRNKRIGEALKRL